MVDYPSEITDSISRDLEEEHTEISNKAESEPNLDLRIKLRVQQLSLSKILVQVHKRSSNLLIDGLQKLSEAYIQNECFEPALEHLQRAHKLSKSLSEEPNLLILSSLGTCYMHMDDTNSALKYLTTALEISQKKFGEESLHCFSLYKSLANILIKRQEHSSALDCLNIMAKITKTEFGTNHEANAPVYQELAGVYKELGDTSKAIESQQIALNTMIKQNLDPADTAECAGKLGTWLQEVRNFPLALDAFRLAEHYNTNAFGLLSAKVAAIKKQICQLLSECGELEEALKEWQEVKEIDSSINSKAFVCDLEEIGNLLLKLNRKSEAAHAFVSASRVLGDMPDTKKNSEKMNDIIHKLMMITEEVQAKENTHPPNRADDSYSMSFDSNN